MASSHIDCSVGATAVALFLLESVAAEALPKSILPFLLSPQSRDETSRKRVSQERNLPHMRAPLSAAASGHEAQDRAVTHEGGRSGRAWNNQWRLGVHLAPHPGRIGVEERYSSSEPLSRMCADAYSDRHFELRHRQHDPG